MKAKKPKLFFGPLETWSKETGAVTDYTNYDPKNRVEAPPLQDVIRAGYSGRDVVIKIRTQGKCGYGWKILERGFDNYSQAVDRLRILLSTGQFIEG